jgi:sigma-B regulation protein RsbU (phosphoserine phosphatase)
MPLGIMPEIHLDSRSVIIPPGGMAVLYSDGLSEALAPDDEEFGTDRLLEELSTTSHLSAEEICTHLWATVQQFRGDCPQSDDFTMVVIKRAR